MIETLYLVRHGETVHNVSGIAQGWSDSDLSDLGRQQVERLAERFRVLKPTAIYSSTLGRARSTAEAIAKVTGLEVHPMDDLREMNCGRWEGVSFLKVRKEEKELYERWVNDPTLACPEGESFEDIAVRFMRAMHEIDGRENGSPARPVVVSHATAIRIVATRLLNLPLTAARQFAQDNAALNIFERRGDRYILRTWNDATHCRQLGPPAQVPGLNLS